MFFNLENELILRQKLDGESLYQFVYGAEKSTIDSKISGNINAETRDQGVYLETRRDGLNVVHEIINRVPMLLNLLQNREYKNILFVGHFHSGQPSWVLDEYQDRVVDILPEDRKAIADQNVLVQFLPILHKMMGYKGNFSVCVPPEPQHRGLVHSMYNMVGCDSLPTTVQYRHGMTADDFGITVEPTGKFDAVVFLGCPKKSSEVSFSASRVEQLFAPYCTEDFDLVDLYYGAPDAAKWKNGVKKDIATDLDVVLTTRATWDSAVKVDGVSPEEVEILKRTVKVF